MGAPSLSSPSQTIGCIGVLFATGILFSKILILYIYIYKYIILDFLFIVSQGGGIGFKNNCDSVIVMRSAGCVRRVIVMGDFVKKVVQGVQVEYIIWRRQADKEVSHRSSGCRFQRADAGSKQADGSPGVPSLFLRSPFALTSLFRPSVFGCSGKEVRLDGDFIARWQLCDQSTYMFHFKKNG